jgi:hypothetical protein
MNRFVVDPAHLDVLLSLAINGPSDQPEGSPWPAPSAAEMTGDPGPLTRLHADDVGAALMSMCIGSVAHFYAGAGVPRLPGPDPLPAPGLYEWSNLGRFLTMDEGFVALSCYEFNSNCNPRWYASPHYAFCNRLRARLAASLPGCRDARLHWSTEAVLERADIGLSLERVLRTPGVRADKGADPPATPP